MRREASPVRSGWREKAEAIGFTFHTHEDGQTYWREDARWRFTLAEIEDDLEASAATLLGLCYDAVGRIVEDAAALDRLDIPRPYHDAIRASWQAADRDLYGRFDLAYDGSGPPKLLEFNADTPTALIESAVFQWQWLEDLKSLGALPAEADQFNSIHERLIAALRRLEIVGPLHLTAMAQVEEDSATIAYMADVARQAGVPTIAIPIEQIGRDAEGRLTDLADRRIANLFKLYPWEFMIREAFGPLMAARSCRVFEPIWKLVLSNKGLLAELWRLNPGHPNLLETYYEDDPAADRLKDAPTVAKPLLGREGANVELRDGGAVARTEGPYRGRRVVQRYQPLASADGMHVVLGAWVVAGEPAGLSVREERGAITTNRAAFVPHVILG